jgi:hypothetical protein
MPKETDGRKSWTEKGGTNPDDLEGGSSIETPWPPRPIVYEIYTWVWLQELGRQYKRTITLGTVPDEQWDAIAALGVDAVWLMGVWERSPAGIRVANLNEALQEDFDVRCPTMNWPTTSARRTACAGMPWTNTLAARQDSGLLARSWHSAVSA